MDNLSFVLWMLLFPLIVALEKYFYAKIAEIKKEQDQIQKNNTIINLLIAAVWIVVGILLYRP
jgi:hypothetical protein